MQSSTWSNHKHHNTTTVLVGCTPNGAVSYISQLFVGSISDMELTNVSMADRGITVRDLLAQKGVDLNIPPFTEGRQQLPANHSDTTNC